jgi:hypothetical protein
MTTKNSPDRIDLSDEAQMSDWAKKLNATPQQLQEAVDSVGNQACDVEMHLKGTRSTTNSEEVRKATKNPPQMG